MWMLPTTTLYVQERLMPSFGHPDDDNMSNSCYGWAPHDGSSETELEKEQAAEFRAKYPNIANEPTRCAACLNMPPCGCGDYVSMKWAYPNNY